MLRQIGYLAGARASSTRMCCVFFKSNSFHYNADTKSMSRAIKQFKSKFKQPSEITTATATTMMVICCCVCVCARRLSSSSIPRSCWALLFASIWPIYNNTSDRLFTICACFVCLFFLSQYFFFIRYAKRWASRSSAVRSSDGHVLILIVNLEPLLIATYAGKIWIILIYSWVHRYLI